MSHSSPFLNGVVMNLNESVCLGSVVSFQLWEERCAEDVTVLHISLWLSTEVHRRGHAYVHMDACGWHRLQVCWKLNMLQVETVSDVHL